MSSRTAPPPSLNGAFSGRIHFVGIGGVGMSGIAELLKNLGCRISGSDLQESAITRRLSGLGIRVFRGHKTSHARGAELLVASSAVARDNPELRWARARGIPVLQRAQMLSQLAKLKKTLTVAGTHGKTTTTSLAAMALTSAGARPTMIIGGQLKNIHGNARLGLGDYLVAEADESDGSFIHLEPLAAVVTNIDDDHLDFHKTMANLKDAFKAHLERLPPDGAAILCADDPALLAMSRKLGRTVVTYGFAPEASWRPRNLRLSSAGSVFDACRDGRVEARVTLRVPGRHNVQNALGALAAGSFLGFPSEKLARGLSRFRGVGRRLDRLGRAGGVEFIDDYGHHPTEIAATIEAVSSLWKPARLIVLFQPHRYTRTKMLAARFGPAFKRADFVYVADIYPGGEKPLAGVDSRLILSSLKRAGVPAAAFARSLDVALQLRPGDLVLTLGAGDIWKTGLDLLRRLRERRLSPV